MNSEGVPRSECQPAVTITGEYRVRHPRAFDICLHDGRWVRVRPIVPTDKDAMERALERLGAKSRYFRFHTAVHRLTESQLRYLTEVDQRHHVAWCVFALGEPGRPGVATVRFVRDAANPVEAEVAITIVDDYQGVGLGRILLDTILLSALEGGVERLVAYVVPENRTAVNLFRSVGAAASEIEAGMLRIDIPVTSERRRYRRSGEVPRPGSVGARLPGGLSDMELTG